MSEKPTDNPAARVLSEAITHLTEMAEDHQSNADHHTKCAANAAEKANLCLKEAAQIREALLKLEGTP